MIVFKTFLKVLNKCKVPIIMYTVILVTFGAFNMKTSENSMSFTPSKPDILIINNDESLGITGDFIEYISKNSNIKNIQDTQEAISDALFYRDVNIIIYIPKNFRQDFLNKLKPNIEVKSTGDYQSSLALLMVNKYIKIANIYLSEDLQEDAIIKSINSTLENESQIDVISKLDTDSLSKMSLYYNFANYSILAGTVYVICLILSSFKKEEIRKRTIISSMNYKSLNRKLLLANGLFALVLFVVYVVLSFALLGDIMFSIHGAICIINLFFFTICALTISFLIANLVTNKNAINGIVNVIALGSSFLCGAFVPIRWLPDIVINIAHVLPSYWYIKTNDLVVTLENINFNTIKPIIFNMCVIVAFSIFFVVITNIVSSKKRKMV